MPETNYFSFLSSENVFGSLSFLKGNFAANTKFQADSSLLWEIKNLCHFPLDSIISDENWLSFNCFPHIGDVSFLFSFFVCCFPSASLKIFPLSSVFRSLTWLSSGLSYLWFIWILESVSLFLQIWEFQPFKYFFSPTLFPSSLPGLWWHAFWIFYYCLTGIWDSVME